MNGSTRLDILSDIPVHGIRDKIADHVARLEKQYGRITSCRVAVKRRSDHHRNDAYAVHIRMALPAGREVDVARTPQADERHADIDFAIDDAFKRARRQLRESVSRLKGAAARRKKPLA